MCSLVVVVVELPVPYDAVGGVGGGGGVVGGVVGGGCDYER